jgi:hypothetical protein
MPSGTSVSAPRSTGLPSGTPSEKAHAMMGIPGGIFSE